MARGARIIREERKRTYARGLFEGMTQTDAYNLAGYTGRAHSNASILSRDPFVVSEIQRLRQAAEDPSIMSVIERKQLLSILGRSQLADFLNDDGTLKPIDPDSPSVAALSELTISPDGAATKLKLHDPIRAIEALNKMERLYDDGAAGATLNDNRQVWNIYVESERGRELVQRLLAGEGTE